MNIYRSLSSTQNRSDSGSIVSSPLRCLTFYIPSHRNKAEVCSTPDAQPELRRYARIATRESQSNNNCLAYLFVPNVR